MSVGTILSTILIWLASAQAQPPDLCSLSLGACVGPWMGSLVCSSNSDCLGVQACQAGQCVCPVLQGWEGADVPFIRNGLYCNNSCTGGLTGLGAMAADGSGGCVGGVDEPPVANRLPYDPCRGPPPFFSKKCDVPSPVLKALGRPLMLTAVIVCALCGLATYAMLFIPAMLSVTRGLTKSSWQASVLLLIERALALSAWSILIISLFDNSKQQSSFAVLPQLVAVASTFSCLAYFSMDVVFIDIAVAAEMLPRSMGTAARVILYPVAICFSVGVTLGYLPDVGGIDWSLGEAQWVIFSSAIVLWVCATFCFLLVLKFIKASKMSNNATLQASLKKALIFFGSMILILPFKAAGSWLINDSFVNGQGGYPLDKVRRMLYWGHFLWIFTDSLLAPFALPILRHSLKTLSTTSSASDSSSSSSSSSCSSSCSSTSAAPFCPPLALLPPPFLFPGPHPSRFFSLGLSVFLTPF